MSLLALSACGAAGSPTAAAPVKVNQPSQATAPSAQAGKIPLRLAYGAPIVQTLPLWAAYQGGFFAKEGFKPTAPEALQGPEATTALVGGQVDLIATGGYSTALAVGQGYALRMIAANDQYAPFTVVTRKALASPAALRGLRVGDTGPASEPFIEMVLYLHHVGMTPKDVVFLKTGLEGPTLAAMKSGGVDVGLFQWPVLQQSEKAGFHVLSSLAQDKLPWILSGDDVPLTMIQRHPNEVARIRTALVDATQYARSHPAFAESVLKKFLRLSNPTLLKGGDQWFRSAVVPNLAAPPAAVNAVVNEVMALNPKMSRKQVAAFYSGS